MKTEFEVKFYPINREKFIEKLKKIWWICIQEETLMRRTIFYHPTNKDAYLRVRDEWWKITCTFKEILPENLNISSVKEIETEVWDYSSMVNILKNIWVKQKSVQETKREVWFINGEVEIMIDIWPWLEYFVEIEAKNEEIVKKYSEVLWFSWDDAIFWATDQIWKKVYGVSEDFINTYPEITFENPPKF